ncbi:hypothetical protein [Lentzea flaviverrucosa]|uniref:Thioesterase domain-containing protein n=1 Tax=Lentzea flaviverrucosa TaxID=200379 RepID=A0A1H9WUG6_9PSEU|nr:hypothetical protein [Lentzea flaviverrucosa]RDI23107.1 hypothetical protein DFR72_111238 [Lentzea flaviverrucosa]SES37431.1 hypothetical protein SAMN05216195_112232 [Lentzea flaviverrucosa]
MHIDGWKTLASHDGGDIVLAVDFTLGRPDASFADLAREFEVDAAVLETEVVGPGRSGKLSVDPERYLSTWLDGVAARAGSVVGVMGYCAGASFAVALVDRLAERFSLEPKLILLNPLVVSPEIIRGEFVDAVRALDEGLTELEVEGELRWLDALFPDGEVQLVALGEALLARYRSCLDVVVERLELEDDVVDELSSRFASYLDYLMAASGVPLVGRGSRPVVVYDTAYEVAPEFARRCVRIDVGGGHLLGAAGVADVCSALFRQLRRPVVLSGR